MITLAALQFDDGINIDTTGHLRPLELPDGWYVTGEGLLIPVESEEDANHFIKYLQAELKDSAAFFKNHFRK